MSAVIKEIAGQRSEKTGNRDRILNERATVWGAKLNGRVFKRRPQHPPNVGLILDRTGADKGADISVILLLIGKMFRDPRPRNFIVGGKPIALQPSVASLPEGRRCRKRKQERKIRDKTPHQLNAAGRIGNLDMDMHAAEHVPTPNDLQLPHDAIIALRRRM